MAEAIIASTNLSATEFPKVFASELSELKDTDWYFEYFVMHDLRLCGEGVLQDAYESAPTVYARSYVQGAIDMRTAFAIVSGNPIGFRP